MQIEKINSKDKFGREIILISIPKIENFDLNKLQPISKYFTLFIANNIALDIDNFFEKAKDLIKTGLAYMCAWGNGCSVLDNLFDDASVILEIDGEVEKADDENVIMTTWHEDESLKEALHFFVTNTSPTEKYYKECLTALVLCVGRSDETENLKMYLENQKLLDED